MTRHLACLALALAACSKPAAREQPREPAPRDPFQAPSGLTTMPSHPDDIALRWEHRATAPGGSFVEFRMAPDESFTLLDAVWAETHTFVHADVAPDTTFIYRVRPFFGAPSEVAEITTGAETSPSGEQEGPLPEPGPAGARKPLRDPHSVSDAAPANVTAALSASTTAIVRWTDRASDEDGYLLEMATAGAPAFQICALLPPDTTSFRKMNLPPRAKIQFRARAYFLGTPSNVATVAHR